MAKVKGLTIGIGADTSEFKKGMATMNKELRYTSQEIRSLEKSLKIEFDAKTFAQAQQKARDAIDVTDQKVQSLKNRLQTLEDAGKIDGAEYRKLESELTKTEASAVLLKDKLQQLKDLRIEELANKFKTVGDGITKAGQALAPFSAAAAALLGSFAAIASSAVKAGDEIGTVAQQLNISTDALQKWQYIAQQTDVDQSQLVNGIKKVQQALGNLAAGEVEATSDALRALGFTQEQATKGMQENFEPIINALSNMEDATMQAHYANELFGARMAANIIPMLNDGGAGLAALAAEFENFNYLTEEEVQKLDAFEDVLDKLKYQFETIKNQIGVALLPTMEALADVVQNKILPAVQSLADKFSGLSERQQQIIMVTLTTVAALAPMLLIIGKLTSGVGGAIKSVAGLSKVFSLLAAHPIIAIIGVIAGLMIYLYNTNEQFKESVNKLIAVLSSALQPILQVITQVFNQLLGVIMPVVNMLASLLVPLIDALAQALIPVVNIMMTLLMPQLEMFVKITGVLFGALVPIINLISKILVPVIELFGKIIVGVFSFLEKGVETFLEAIDWVANQVIDFINSMIRGFNSLGQIIGVTFDELENVDISSSIQRSVDVNYNTGSIETPEIPDAPNTTLPTSAAGQAVDAIGSTELPAAQTVVNNNQDYSTKDITIEVTIENYAEQVDVDNLVDQINIKLAEQM